MTTEYQGEPMAGSGGGGGSVQENEIWVDREEDSFPWQRNRTSSMRLVDDVTFWIRL
jgi:hypothetical protein